MEQWGSSLCNWGFQTDRTQFVRSVCSLCRGMANVWIMLCAPNRFILSSVKRKCSWEADIPKALNLVRWENGERICLSAYLCINCPVTLPSVRPTPFWLLKSTFTGTGYSSVGGTIAWCVWGPGFDPLAPHPWGIVVPTYDPYTWEVETGESSVLGLPQMTVSLKREQAS